MKGEQQRQPAPPATTSKPTIIGIYGVPGCGKSHLLQKIRQELGHSGHDFTLVDGSALIHNIVQGGLEAFKKLTVEQKTQYRELTIEKFKQRCVGTRTVGVVTGHYMFWDNETADAGEKVWTDMDREVYTHILYLEVPCEVLASRRKNDTSRTRPELSVEHLRKWQDTEKRQLRDLCLEKGVLSSVISDQSMKSQPQASLHEKVVALLQDFKDHTEEYNMSKVEDAVDTIVTGHDKNLETMLVLDADKTLAPEDAGSLFWEMVDFWEMDPLKTLFKTQEYSYNSFRQATLLYEQSETNFEFICNKVASRVKMYPEFVSFLKRVAQEDHVGAVVVTCGLRYVWEEVLKREGLNHVKVIGGGRTKDGYVVTGDVKGAVVDCLHAKGLHVVTFGDSPLDIEMFKKADQAIVVVGDEASRSKTMDETLSKAIEQGLQAHQVVLPKTAPPRLDIRKLPMATVFKSQLLLPIFCHRTGTATGRSASFLHATAKNAAKVLMTQTRDASIAGPSLREAHRRVGWYLTTEFLYDLIGVEEYEITHVQGNKTTGYRLQHEEKTVIIPLMRGGEPMAFGVSDALPLASFLHAKNLEDVAALHLKNKSTVILVDSVVNSGKSVIRFVERIYQLSPTIRIVIVSGVVQDQAIISGEFADMLAQAPNLLHLIALRTSENKYTGKGGTDTGHRLFNTTDQD